MSELADRLRGKFIVLDGPDGSGKSTQLALLAEHLRRGGAAVEAVHDPGTTAVGEKIRAILLDRDHPELAPGCEVMLFMASRAQLVHERVAPALRAGKVVLCDRFVSATVAYQGASGIDPETVVAVARVAVAGTWPDLTVILDVPVEVGMHRAGSPRDRLKASGDRSSQPSLFGDRLEGRARGFHEAVRDNFLRLCEGRTYPGRVVKVDGRESRDQVHRRILAELQQAFCGPGEVP